MVPVHSPISPRRESPTWHLVDDAPHDLGFVTSYLILLRPNESRESWITRLDTGSVSHRWTDDLLSALHRLDLARGALPLQASASEDDLGRWARTLMASIEGSPLPDEEWTALHRVLLDRLPGLVGVSSSSAGRYRSGARPTPDAVATRLHILALIVSDLSGSYNDMGIRRWFERPRTALAARAPADILIGDWDPEAEEVRQVRDLAAWLTGQVTRDPLPQR